MKCCIKYIFLLTAFTYTLCVRGQSICVLSKNRIYEYYAIDKTPKMTIRNDSLVIMIGEDSNSFSLKDLKYCTITDEKGNTYKAGDVDKDHYIDSDDIERLIEHILAKNEMPIDISISDLNKDKNITTLDVALLNDIIQNEPVDHYSIIDRGHLGKGYYGNYKTLQASAVYEDRLYVFYNTGYYEVHDKSCYELLYKGKLSLPQELHFGSAHFSDIILHDNQLPLLYVTDDKDAQHRAFVVDFEHNEIVNKYIVTNGHTGAWDFENDIGYHMLRLNDHAFRLTIYSISTNEIYDTFDILSDYEIYRFQTAQYKDGHIYILADDDCKTTQIIDYEIKKNKVRRTYNLDIEGEPEGFYFNNDMSITIISNVGSWTDKENLIHSEYITITKDNQ